MSVIFLAVFLLGGFPVYAAEEPGEESAEKFLRKVIEAYQDQSAEELVSYYDLEEIDGSSVEFEQSLFQSFEAETVRIEGIECLLEEEEYLYMGAELKFRLNDRSEMPYYEYFLLQKVDDSEYVAVPEGEYPVQIERIISENQRGWEQTELYRNYQSAEALYEETHPGNRNVVYDRLILLLNNIPVEMEKNLHMTGTIFVMGIVQLLILSIWILYRDKYYD